MISNEDCQELEDEKQSLEKGDLRLSTDLLKQTKVKQDSQLTTKSINQISQNEYQKIINENYQLIKIILNLKKKFKIRKIQYKLLLDNLIQENEEKDKEIFYLNEQISRIHSLLRQKMVEMKDRCNKIQSLSNDDISYYQTQLESDLIIENDKKNQKIENLNQRNESLKSLIYELTQKNDENESTIKSLTETNEQFNILLLKCKQKIIELTNDKNQNESQIEFLKENKIQSENQIHELKDQNQKIEEKYKKKINRLEIDNGTIIKDLILNKEPIQNLNDSSQIKEFEDLIKKQQNDLDDKENLISRLKILISNNQDKINRMETEIFNLNKQLKICEENDQQIIDIIQTYKIQNFEIKILLKKIIESNHPIKNHICAIVLDLDKMINENQKKNKIINELREEIKNNNV